MQKFVIGKSNMHSDQQEEEKKNQQCSPNRLNGLAEGSSACRQELPGHPMAEIIYVQLNRVTILHTVTQIISRSVERS
jgi:hypothetical protein